MDCRDATTDSVCDHFWTCHACMGSCRVVPCLARFMRLNSHACPALLTHYANVLCRHVICLEYDCHFLPDIGVSPGRLSWLMAGCAAVCGIYASARALRSSMVINGVVMSLLTGTPFDMTAMQMKGGWKPGPTSATMPYYFTPQGSASGYATSVCTLLFHATGYPIELDGMTLSRKL